eukprot:TRINITY_DN81617_c0_g1_i1.p1 TRINITY_DN81617_c0_g1~~TRINITY_DN81617_c0_g1_i1.p1  ORF type:complete len:265 (-),score=54.00 TRINITY_DN81617_c0_g1_i1:102-896(-)
MLVLVAFSFLLQCCFAATLLPRHDRASLPQFNATRRSTSLLSRGRYGPKQAPFFEEDAYKMEEAPNAVPEKPKKCLPQCRWSCKPLSSACDMSCKPSCQPPQCVTACGKPLLSQCKNVCQEQHCVVVCPKTCGKDGCPECYTVCNEPKCELKCGHSFCESKCADPVCAWNCGANSGSGGCQEPKCVMECDPPGAGGCRKNPGEAGQEWPGPRPHDAVYAGQEVAWEGLADLPPGMLKAQAPGKPDTVQPWTFAPAPAPAPVPGR